MPLLLNYLQRTVQFAVEMGVTKIVVELDSKSVASMIGYSTKNLSAVGPVIEDIKEMLKSFENHKIKWARTTEINKWSSAYHAARGC